MSGNCTHCKTTRRNRGIYESSGFSRHQNRTIKPFQKALDIKVVLSIKLYNNVSLIFRSKRKKMARERNNRVY